VLVVHTPRSDTPERGLEAGALRIVVLNPKDEFPWHIPRQNRPIVTRVPDLTRRGNRVRYALCAETHIQAEDRQRYIDVEMYRLREMCTKIAESNRDVADESDGDLPVKLRGEDRLLSPHFEGRPRATLERLSRVREPAAAVSRGLQSEQDTTLGADFLALGLSYLCFHIYAHWLPEGGVPSAHPGHIVLCLWMFWLLLTGAGLLVIEAWWSRGEKRRQDSRVMAEAPRVRRAWSIAGIGLSVADGYVGQLRNEVSWMRQALLNVCPPSRMWVTAFDALGEQKQIDHLVVVHFESNRGLTPPARQDSDRKSWRAGGVSPLFLLPSIPRAQSEPLSITSKPCAWNGLSSRSDG
jgi:hypothetical protein